MIRSLGSDVAPGASPSAYAWRMETTPRPNPYDAGQPHVRPGARRRPGAGTYWVVFAVAVVLWLASAGLPVAVLAADVERPELVLGLTTAVTILCATVGGVALGLAVATGITEDRTRLLVGLGMALLGAFAMAFWQMFLHAGGVIANLGLRPIIGAVASPLLVSGVVCVLAGLRERSR